MRARATSRQPSAGLQVALHTRPEALADAWDALADSLLAAPFLRPGWIGAWSRAFARGDLHALTATREGELVGVLPFVERRGVLAAPANWHTPVFGFLASGPDVAASLASSLLARARVRADISFLDSADPNLQECVLAARRARQPMVVRSILRSPYVEVAGSSWEAYRASLERKPRRDIERRRRRLEEQGSVSVEFRRERTEPAALLAEGFGLEGSGWKHQRGSAITSHQATHRFYSEIARWAASRGWLLLAFLRLDGRPIAFDLCLRSDGTSYVLKGGFDPAFRRFAPGMVLTYESLRQAFDEGLSSYELLGDDDPYKLVFTQAVRERVRLQAFRRSPAGLASQLVWTHGRSGALATIGLARRLQSWRRADRPNATESA